MSTSLFFDGERTPGGNSGAAPDPSRRRFETMLIRSYHDMRSKSRAKADPAAFGPAQPQVY